MQAFHKLTVPARGQPLVRFIFEQMNIQCCGYLDMEARSGIPANTLKQWQCNRRNPTLNNAIAAMNALGFDLVPIERKE